MGTNQRSKIRMTDEEIDEFLHGRHTMSMATIGPGGRIQLVAMWYGFLDGDIAFETKTKSQKVANLRRDDRLTVMVEDGDRYEVLRGVELSGRGEIIEDMDQLRTVGISVVERYYGGFTAEVEPMLEAMLRKRVVVRLHADKIVSWDHRKL
jgi:PPOX class probable F420-dependent enzyme